MRKLSLGTAALAVLVAGAWLAPIVAANAADGTRLDDLESENARLRRENAALRERVRLQTENATLKRQLGEKPVPQAQPAAASNWSNPALQAYAADRPVTKAPPLGPVPYNWSGFYLGAHFGAGWSRNQWTDVSPDCGIGLILDLCTPSNLGAHNAIGVLGGGQLGFNWQVGRVVFGVEGQYSLADLKGDHQNNFLSDEAFTNVTSTFNQSLHLFTRVTDFATIAGRIGLAADPLDRTLLFAKGGVAFVRNKYSATSSQTLAQCVGTDCVTALDTGSFGGSQTRWGWMAGVGLEHALFDNVSATIEYDYLDFGSKTVSLPGTVHDILIQGALDVSTGDFARTKTFNINQSIHAIKFGLNYRFTGFAP